MDSKRSCVVYGLASSAEPDRIRYIGQTTLVPDLRLRIHVNQARYTDRTAVHRWINRHVADGHRILMVVLLAGAEYHRDEQRIIAEYRADGVELLNHTDGGEGGYGFKHAPDECLRRSDRARRANANRDAEINQRISATLRGRTLPAEVRAKMAAAHAGEKNHFHGRAHTEASRIANAKARAKLTDDQVREMRRRCAAGEMQKDLRADYGLSKAQISQAVRGETYWWVD